MSDELNYPVRVVQKADGTRAWEELDKPSELAQAHGSAAGVKCNWRIEYEIPPLRAIYFAEAGQCTEAEAREQVKTEQPLWRIRKMERQNDRTEPRA